MARTATFVFVGDAASVIRAAKAAEAATAGLAAETERAGARIAVAQKEAGAAAQASARKIAVASAEAGRAGALGMVGLRSGVMGAVIALGDGIKTSIQFQAAMEQIHTQAGASQREVNKMSTAVLGLAHSTEQGPVHLAKALYELESVGLRGKVALEALKAASEGASVGGADLTATTSALASTMVAYHVRAKQAGETMGALNAIVGVGKMHMDGLNAALASGILPTAKAAGLSLQSVGAALATLTDAGVPAEQAAQKLRTTFFLMAAPTSKATAALKAIHLSHDALAKAMRHPNGLVGALTLLRTHMEGLTKVQKVDLLSQAFGGSRSAATMVTLIDNLNRVQKKYTDIGTGTKQFAADVAAQHKTAAAKIGIAWSSIQADLGLIGDHVKNAAGSVATALATVVGAIRSVADWFGKGGTVATALKGALIGLTAALVTIAAATKGFAIAQGILNLVMEANPLVRVATVLAVVAGAVIALNSKTHFLSAAWKWLKKAFSDVIDWIGGAAHTAFGLVKKAAEIGLLGPVGLIISHWKTVKHFFSNLPGEIVAFFASLPGRLLDVGKAVIDGLVSGIRSGVGAVFDAFKSIASKAVDLLTHPWRVFSPSRLFFDIGANVARGLADGIRGGAGMVAEAARAGLLFPLDAAITALKQQQQNLQDTFSGQDATAQRGGLVSAIGTERGKPKNAGGIQSAIKALHDFDVAAARSNQLAKIDLQVKGLEQLRAFRDAVAGIRDRLSQAATAAAGVFRKGREAQIAGGPQATELAALKAKDAAEADAKQTEQLNANMAAAIAAGDVKAQEQAQDAIDAYARQKREQALQDSIASQTAGLDAEEANYQSSLDARLGVLASNLAAGKESYTQFVADTLAILAPLNVAFAGLAGEEATITLGAGGPAAPAPTAAAVHAARKKGRTPVRHRAKHRAMGGPIAPGEMYIVGEHGPELFRSRTAGQIIPNGPARSAAGGVTQNFYNTTIGSTKQAEMLAHRLAFRLQFVG